MKRRDEGFYWLQFPDLEPEVAKLEAGTWFFHDGTSKGENELGFAVLRGPLPAPDPVF